MSSAQEQATVECQSPVSEELNEEDLAIQRQIEKPLVPQTYHSSTMQDTDAEIMDNKVTSRPVIRMRFCRKRKYFNGNYKFNDTDANDKRREIGSQSDPLFHQKRQVLETGIQGKSEVLVTSTQTNWNRKINRILEPIQSIEEQEAEKPYEDDDLAIFLYNVYPVMEQALQSNETIDIFHDDFDVLPQEEFNKNESEVSNTIKEIKSFQSLKAKNKKVNCIQFQPSHAHPKARFVIAQSFTENLSFDDRASLGTKSYNNNILFWDFETIHSIDPILQLQSSLEIVTFEFNPKDYNTLVAGALNGQILLFDLKSFNTNFYSKNNKKSKSESEGHQKINPLTTSALQDPSGQSGVGTEILRKTVNSHKNPVLCIKWLPSSIEFDRKYIYNLLTPTNTEVHNQFLSISEDGQILFWDTRIGEKLDARGQTGKQQAPIDVTTVPWRAHYGIQLNRPDGGGVMGGSYIQFNKQQKNSHLVGTSDEGELFQLEWAQKQTEDNPKLEYVNKVWQTQRSMRAVIGMDRSVFFNNIVLTLHDYHFVIWRLDTNEPIFESAMLKNCQISCGVFSPTRPGLVFIGRTDGRLDIWDFTDQSHQETMNHQVSSSGISTIKFHSSPQCSNILALGDYDGTLHVLELPQMLSKKHNNEELVMQQFWDREVQRVSYFQGRFEVREEAHRQVQMQQQQRAHDEQEVQEESDDLELPDEDEMETNYQTFLSDYENVLNPKAPEEKEKKK